MTPQSRPQPGRPRRSPGRARGDDRGRALDVLVVGGGVVGAGVALDAVTRGLSTGLLEQRDLASGTSRPAAASSIHGGLRYLEMLDFGLVREALAGARPAARPGWRRTWSGRCRSSTRSPTAAGSGRTSAPGWRSTTRMAMARQVRHGRAAAPPPDPRAGRRGSPRTSRRVASPARSATTTARSTTPGCVVTVARTAAAPRRPRRDPGQGHRLPPRGGAGRRRPRSTSRPAPTFEVRARVVVNAAGVWTDEIQEMVGGRGALHVQASKGIHLVVPRDRIRSEAGFIVRTETSVLFVIPWGRHWIIGTTDTPWDLDKAHPAASPRRHRLRPRARQRDPARAARPRRRRGRLRRAAAAAVRGVRADLADLAASTPSSRRCPGLVMIAGGKLHDLPRHGPRRRRRRRPLADHHGDLTVRDSITDRVPLLGADGFETRTNQRVAAGPPLRAARRPGSTTCSAATATWSTTCSR